MRSMRYEDLGDVLIEAVPELGPTYESEVKDWPPGEWGAHLIYGDLLNPYLICLLDRPDQEDVLGRIFALLERLTNQDDVRIQEVVAVTVCERLGSDKARLRRAQKYMGETTLKFSHEVEAFWG